MKGKKLPGMLLTMSIVILGILTAQASVPLLISNQGRLLNAAGQPVTGAVSMIFSIWDDSTGGNQLWSETQTIQVSDGIFSTSLGGMVPLDQMIFRNSMLWLQTQIPGDVPMMPRQKLNSNPFAFTSEGVNGDVMTSPSSIMIGNLAAAQSQIDITARGDTGIFAMMFQNPGHPPNPNLALISGPTVSSLVIKPPYPDDMSVAMLSGTTSGATLVMKPPAPDDVAVLQLSGDASGAAIAMRTPSPDDVAVLTLSGNNLGSSLVMRPPNPNVPTLDLSANSVEALLRMRTPTVDDVAVLTLSGDANGSAIAMRTPSPDDVAVLTLSGDVNGSAIAMRTPTPDDVAVLIMSGNSTGSSLVMKPPSPNSQPILAISGNTDNASIDIKPPNPNNISAISISGNTNGASMVMRNPGPNGFPVMLNSDGTSGGIGILQTDATGQLPAVQLNTNIDGSSFVMHPPSPNSNPFLQMTFTSAGGNFSFIDPAGMPSMNLNSGGGGYFMGNLGFGTSSMTNILTVAQGSPSEPIADAWTTYSSRRWKENIQTLNGSLDKVMRLRGVSFDWKSNGKHDIGVIAEEVGQVVPEVVTYEKNGVDARSVDYARLTALLIEAVKEQQKAIIDLQSQVTELKAQNQKQADLTPGR